MNPHCPLNYHLVIVENTPEEGAEFPAELVIARLNRKQYRNLEHNVAEEHMDYVINSLGELHDSVEIIPGLQSLESFPKVATDVLDKLIQETKAHDTHTTTDARHLADDVVNENSVDPAVLIDYDPDPNFQALDQARARKYHYESEIARLQALELSRRLLK